MILFMIYYGEWTGVVREDRAKYRGLYLAWHGSKPKCLTPVANTQTSRLYNAKRVVLSAAVHDRNYWKLNERAAMHCNIANKVL